MAARNWKVFGGLVLAVAGLAWAQGIASRGVKPQPRSKPSGVPFYASFTNVAKEAGLTAPMIYGEEDHVTYITETTAGGIAAIDYDNDGLIDVFFTGGDRLSGTRPEFTQRLYRNLGNLRFQDVTEKAGLLKTGWASGVSVGDFDGDGWVDLYVTYWGDNILYRNNGNGTFADVTASAGVQLPRPKGKPLWSSGATFIDYDRDGRLDLFVSNYVNFDLEKTPKPGENGTCNWKGVPVACGPRGLPTARPWLFHNVGNGKFEDVSEASGVAAARASYDMTAVATDFDGDGWTDLYVACDSTPSLFFRNLHNGKFAEEGVERGIALNDDGMEQAGMGVGLGDFNADGLIDIAKTHFADDTHVLYRNEGKGQFSDVTLRSGLGVETRYIGWGVGVQDLDNDGWPDLFIGTGNVYAETEEKLPAYPYHMPPLFFRNLDGSRFEQLFEQAGPALVERHCTRGVVFADLDNDGDLEIVMWNRNEPPSLLRNDLKVPSQRHWLQVELQSDAGNRNGIGAQVTVPYGARKQTQAVLSQSSFYSSNGLRLHFGLGDALPGKVTVAWPSGKRERFSVEADRLVRLKEGKGESAAQ